MVPDNCSNSKVIDLRDPVSILKLKRCDTLQEYSIATKEEGSLIYCCIKIDSNIDYELFKSLYEGNSNRTILVFDAQKKRELDHQLREEIYWDYYAGTKVLYNLKCAEEESKDRINPSSYQICESGDDSIRIEDTLIDTMLISENGLTLFENLATKTLEHRLVDYAISKSNVDYNGGYKIPRSHFRIGTKIHVKDFYFGKRFFQNSQYSSKFSILVARDIIREQIPEIIRREERLEELKEKIKLTLIGYGQYSDLILSNIKDLLNATLLNFDVNHNLISDEENVKLVKVHEKIHDNVIIIVPISSTFSTSIKLEEFLLKLNPKSHISEPHINVINVFDANDDIEIPSKIEKKFHWIYIEPRLRQITVRIPNHSTIKSKIQRYFLRLPTKWYDVKECELCFPSNPLNETPLFVTDKTSVTPNLIFDTPKGRPLKSKNRGIVQANMLRYGHFIGRKSHNLYLINREDYFRKNLLSIENWLFGLKENTPTLFDPEKRVTIIAPSHYSNVGFASLVNRVLFDNRGNIIHYDVSEGNVQNFSAFYGSDINSHLADTNLFFVDDMLVTGHTFEKCASMLKHTRRDYRAFTGCIILIDRSDDFVQKNVTRELDSNPDLFMSFSDLLLTSIYNVDESCPICIEKDRYDKLIYQSYLDKTQVHFVIQSNKLQLRDPLVRSDVTVESDTYLRRIEATHRIYDWFFLAQKYEKTINQYESIHLWVEDIIATTESPFLETVLIDKPEETNSDTFMKVLTQSPMTHYMPVKTVVFGWLLSEMDVTIRNVKLLLSRGGFDFLTYRKLKFMIRRLGQMQSNILISVDFLKFVNLLYGDNGIPYLLGQLEIERKEQDSGESLQRIERSVSSLKSFFVFYTAQIKELLYQNEARCIRLENIVQSLLESEQINKGFGQILRILQEENGLLITSYANYISSHVALDTNSEYDDNKGVRDVLNKNIITQSFRHKEVEEFINIGLGRRTPLGLQNNVDFINYISLVTFLRTEKHHEQSLVSKIENLVNKMRDIVFEHSVDSGAFLAVKYARGGRDNLFFAYNKGNRGSIKEFPARDSGNYFSEFLYGIKDATRLSVITIVELSKNNIGKWQDMYSDEIHPDTVTFKNGLVPSDYNRLLMLRVDAPSMDFSTDSSRNSAQAILCFYSRQTRNKTTSIKKTRYLLLLRPLLSDFIREHHGNNEFKDWMDAMLRRRTSLLTGHGRDMLMELARVSSSKIDYKNILFTILLTQRTLLEELDLNGVANTRRLASLISFLNVGREVVDEFYCQETLKIMADEMFRFEIIENKELVDVLIDFKSDPFLFSYQVIECICFELFLNAKKNRYSFFENEIIHPEVSNEPPFNRNRIWIRTRNAGKNSVILEISNTGPRLSSHVRDSLSNNYNIKDTGEIGGLEMISTIMERFKFGKLSLGYRDINAPSCLSYFDCILTLNVPN